MRFAGMDMKRQSQRALTVNPPQADELPLINASESVARWLTHYWRKLKLPEGEATRLAVTDDRQEFARWTGRRLNPLALGCYCFLPNAKPSRMAASATAANHAAPAITKPRIQLALPGFETPNDTTTCLSCDDEQVDDVIETTLGGNYRHLIFIEPDLLPLSTEVTVAHELIHLSDRVRGNPRKHRCHGHDSISVDEAAITGQDPELLREQLRTETERRETALRKVRPYRYVFACPECGKEYMRVRRYARPVSCGRCDRQYNPAFLLQLVARLDASGVRHSVPPEPAVLPSKSHRQS